MKNTLKRTYYPPNSKAESIKITPLHQTIKAYDAMAQQYAKIIVGYGPDAEFSYFTKLISSGGYILDAGCGPGRDVRLFSQQGFLVTGIDLSRNLLREAQKADPQGDYRYMDIRQLSFPNYSFDGIWACASLLHLQRQEIPPTLIEFFRVLKSGGIILITVKQGQGEATYAEDLSSGYKRFFTFFELKEMRQLVATAGFKLLKTYTYNEKNRHIRGRDLNWVVVFAQKPA